MINEWKKHDESENCPAAVDSWIEVETYASTGNIIALAANLSWEFVKFYRIVPAKK